MARNAYVKTADGWEQIATSVSAAAQGLAPIVPASVTDATVDAGGKISFSGATSIGVNGVFDSKYDSYRIIFNATNTGTTTASYLRMRSAGTNTSTSNYLRGGYISYGIGTGSGNYNSTVDPGFLIGYSTTAAGSDSFIDLIDPAKIAITRAHYSVNGYDANYFTLNAGGTHPTAASYDGFGITVSAGTITGTIQVYGYSALANPLDIPEPSPNYLINGGFDFWQRGTSFSADGYCADRWYFDETGTCTVTQTSSALPAGFNYAAEAAATTSSDSADLYQVLESAVVIPLRGQRVTFSCYLKMDANMIAQSGAFELVADYSSSTDARVSQTTAIGTVTLTKSAYSGWARATYTFMVPADAVGLKVGIEPPLTSSPTSATYWMTGAMLELGSTATDFRRAGSTYSEEQNACFRYYYRAVAESAYGWFGQMHMASNVLGLMPLPVPVNMRTIPHTMDSGGSFQYFGSTGTISSLTLSGDGSNTRQVTVNVGGTGFTGAGSGFLRANNSATAFIGVSAEL